MKTRWVVLGLIILIVALLATVASTRYLDGPTKSQQAVLTSQHILQACEASR